MDFSLFTSISSFVLWPYCHSPQVFPPLCASPRLRRPACLLVGWSSSGSFVSSDAISCLPPLFPFMHSRLHLTFTNCLSVLILLSSFSYSISCSFSFYHLLLLFSLPLVLFFSRRPLSFVSVFLSSSFLPFLPPSRPHESLPPQ